MSNLKRVQLTSVEPTKQENKPKRKTKTFRFELSLGESNAVTCPEYSFAELIKNEKTAPSDDPFNDDDADVAEVAAIAQRFEAKYGPKSAYSGKKKRTREMDDYYDLGDGYDTDDPFIDNTEAYDEVVPSTLTTKHGGFYINQGQLVFRSLSDDSSQAFATPEKTPTSKKKKKNVLASDSEEETGESLAKKFKAMKRKKLLENKGLEKKKKKISDGSDGEPLIKKMKKKNPQKLMKKLSKMREAYGISPNPNMLGQPSTPTTTAASIPSSTAITISTSVNNNAIGTGPLQPPQTTVDMVSSLAVTSVVTTPVVSKTTAGQPVAGVGQGAISSEVDTEEKPGTVITETMRDESSSKSGDEARGEQQSGDKITQLPAQLPLDMLNSIESLKKYAKESTEGKCKFFSPEVNKLLLEIEIGSYSLAWRSRTAIFGHLGDHLPCGKPALLRRAKKLHETQEEDQLQEPTQRLKKEIDVVMPALQEHYRQELQKAKAEAEKSNGTDGPKEEATTESDEDDAKQETAVKKFKRPKRIFPWTKETRQCLENIVTLKMKNYKIFKSRNQTAVDYIKAYLDYSVRPLWPQGWMQTRILMKESRMCHEELAKTVTAQPSKEKVAPPNGKPWPAVTSNSNASFSSASRSLSQPHVTKTEDVIEISGQSHQGTEPAAGTPDKPTRSHEVGGGIGSATIVVDLPGSSPSTASLYKPSAVPSSASKVLLPPVEVIDITDSPSKPSPSQSVMPAGETMSTTPKQSQPCQSSKPVTKLQLHPSPQWARQQPSSNLQQSARNVSTLAAPSPSQSFSAQTNAKQTLPSNLDPMYQAKVVIKPVSVTQGLQHKTVGSAKMLSPAMARNVVSTAGNTAPKPGTTQQKSLLLSNSAQQFGSMSFSPASRSVTSGQTGLGSDNASASNTKLYSQIPQQQKLAANIVDKNSSSSIVSMQKAGTLPRTTIQQVRSGIVLGTSNSHSNVHFTPTQSGSTKTCNLISYRPQQSASSLSAGQQSSPGSTRPTPTAGGGGPGSSKPPYDTVGRQGAGRAVQVLASSSPGLMARPATYLGIQTASPSPPKRLYQPEQPSPPSRGSNSCSPQQVSPGEAGAKLSLYDQIQSHIRSQETMESQALKNLALAMGFTGAKKTLPSDVSTSAPASPHTSRANLDMKGPPYVSSSERKELPQPQSGGANFSTSKLQENLLKLRDTIKGEKSAGVALHLKHPAGLSSQPQAARQLSQPQLALKTVSKSNSAIKESKPSLVELQQTMPSRTEKNIFSEMQKPVYGVESLMQAKKAPLCNTRASPENIFKNNGQGSSGVQTGFPLHKGYNANMTPQHTLASSIPSLYQSRNLLAHSKLEGKLTADSKNGAGGDASAYLSQIERKSYPWPDKFNPDKIRASPSPLNDTKSQGNSGGLSSQ